MFRGHRAWAVARKEIRDILRDRRTVFMAIVFPLILYPLLIIGLVQGTLTQESRARATKRIVAISGGENAPGLVKEIEANEALKVVSFNGKVANIPKVGAAVGLVIPKDFRETIEAGETAEVTLVYDSADQASQDAAGKLSETVLTFARGVLSMRLAYNGIEAEYINPVDIDRRDIATPRKRGAFRLGKMLAFLLVILCLTGALYPALDAISGEKERGTLETLLSIPATRLEILGGKYAAVFSMSVASVVSNFLSLSATMFMVNCLMKSASGGKSPIDFSVPMTAFIIFVPALLPLAALFSAVSLAVAAFARSVREGQYYLAPLYAVVLPLTALAILPEMRLTYPAALVPVLSMALFLKDGLLETLSTGPALVAVASTCVYAALALKWAAGVFSREEVLFASPLSDTVPPAAVGLAKPSHALFVWAVSVILFFFFGLTLTKKYGLGRPLVILMIYAGFVIGPALVYAARRRLDWRKVFPFERIGPRRAVSIALFVPAAILLGMAAHALQSSFLAPPPEMMKAVAGQKVSLYALVLSIALVPAVCEELMYRGFIHQSFAARWRPIRAVVASAALFSIAHLNIYQLLPLFVLGVLLALVVRFSGGLLAAMIVHFCNNAFAVVMEAYKAKIAFLTKALDGPWAVVVVISMAVAGLALAAAAVRVARGARRESD
ncbi:MAG: CPBP family intramembrane metalloprotease [Planctomycetes bacterium]|nr:CPBP family intramembrane metalloprotease [Planctomycetota bacterium]